MHAVHHSFVHSFQSSLLPSCMHLIIHPFIHSSVRLFHSFTHSQRLDVTNRNSGCKTVIRVKQVMTLSTLARSRQASLTQGRVLSFQSSLVLNNRVRCTAVRSSSLIKHTARYLSSNTGHSTINRPPDVALPPATHPCHTTKVSHVLVTDTNCCTAERD